MLGLIKRFLGRKTKVNVEVIYRLNEDIGETLKELERVIKCYPDFDFEIIIKW